MSARKAHLALLLAGAALAACSEKPPPVVDSNAAPTRYKTEIVDTLRTIFDKNNTTSVSNAMVTEPALRTTAPNEQHYIACVRYTAHYADFGMVSTTERVAYFYGGHLNQLIEAGKEQCGNAAYQPFPELNQLCLGKGCR